MHKLSLAASLLIMSLAFSGCTLLGGSQDAETAPALRDASDANIESNSVTPEIMPGKTEPEPSAALPDPAADQKGLQETQDDAPTGVPTQ